MQAPDATEPSADPDHVPGTARDIRLLVRADDMGITHDVNQAILRAHREGIVTSASVMPPAPFFEEAAALCQAHPALAAGVHVTLLGTKTRSVLPPDQVPSLLTPSGFFHETLEAFNAARPDAGEIEREVRAQVDKARRAGLSLVYLDWHRGAAETTRTVLMDLCREQQLLYGQDRDGALYGHPRVDLMPESWPTLAAPDGQRIYLRAPAFQAQEEQVFLDGLAALGPGQWTLVVHPGGYAPQRASVTDLLCAPETLDIIRRRRIRLVNYADLWEEIYGKPDTGQP